MKQILKFKEFLNERFNTQQELEDNITSEIVEIIGEYEPIEEEKIIDLIIKKFGDESETYIKDILKELTYKKQIKIKNNKYEIY
jgi:hypothetical protein